MPLLISLSVTPAPIDQKFWCLTLFQIYAVAECILDLKYKVEANNTYVHQLESQIKWLESRLPIKPSILNSVENMLNILPALPCLLR